MLRPVFLYLLLGVINNLTAQALIPYLDNTLYGYSDPTGILKIPPKYDLVTFFDQGGIAHVQKGNYWSIINTSGKELLPFTAKEQLTLDYVYSTDTIEMYRSKNGTDTLFHLRMQRESFNSFRIVNTRTGLVSPVYTRFTMISNPSFNLPAAPTFERGIFLGKISDTLYHVLNTEAEVIHTTHNIPTMWNDSIVSSEESHQLMLFDVQTHEKFTLPYLDLFAVVNRDLFVVSGWGTVIDKVTQQRNNKFRSGLVDRKNNTILDLKYVSIWGGNNDNPIVVATDEATYFVNEHGERIDTNTYRAIYSLTDNCAKAQLSNGKWVLMKPSGALALSEQYDTLYMVTSNYYGYKRGNIAGLISLDFKTLIQYPADKIQTTQVEGLYTIVENGKIGLINSEGKELVPAIYDECWPVPNIPYIHVTKNGKEGFLRIDGSVVFNPIYDEVTYRRQHDVFLFFTKQNELYTYYDEDLKVVKDSMLTNHYGSRDIYSNRINGGHQLLDRYGKPIGEPVEKFVLFGVTSDSSTHALIYKDKLYFIMKPDGTLLTDDSIRLEKNSKKFNLEGGLFGVKTGSLEGVINHRSEWIVPPGNQEIIGITPYVIVVKKNNSFYLYHLDGASIDHKPFTKLAFDSHQKWWAVEQNQKSGFIDSRTGKIVIPLIYDEASNYYYNYAVVTTGTNTGSTKTFLLDTLGRTVLETSFDKLAPLDSTTDYRHYIVSVGDKEGVINLKGNVILPVKYDQVSSFADTTFYMSMSKRNERQLLNRKAEIVCADPDFPNMDKYLKLPGNRYLLYMNTYAIVLDQAGKILKTIPSPHVTVFEPGNKTPSYLKVEEDEKHYFVNSKTLVAYKKSN